MQQALAYCPIAEGKAQRFRPAHVGLLLGNEAIEGGEEIGLKADIQGCRAHYGATTFFSGTNY